MKPTNAKFAPINLRLLLTIGIIGLLLLPVLGMRSAAAQAPSTDGWTPPVNLSNSGAAEDPLIVVDADNVTHVIWFDEFLGYRYTKLGAEGEWSEPVTVIFPFGEERPKLLRGPNNLLYAFWIDGRDILNSARVQSTNFGNRNAWEPRRPIVNNALAFDVMTDIDGSMHLVYVTNVARDLQPTGVYYRQSLPGGGGWTVDKTIAQSLYFRSLEPEQAHLNITAGYPFGEEKIIYVAWDEPALRKTRMSHSIDNGETWEGPLEIDPPAEDSGTTTPHGTIVTTWRNQTVVVWKRFISENSCENMFQVSQDTGGWSAPDSVSNRITGCWTKAEFLAQNDDMLVWQAEINNQVYLTAWDGVRWSDPITQTGLSGFRDPVSEVVLSMGCRDTVYRPAENTITVVGCDLEGNNDIWVTNKELAGMDTWFPPPSSWEGPNAAVPSTFFIDQLILLSDGEGKMHALWTQPPLTAGSTQPPTSTATKAVYYSTSDDGEDWTDLAVVQNPRPGGVREIDGALSADGELFLTWLGPNDCDLFISLAPASRAFSRGEWLPPTSIPTPTGTCSSPALLFGSGKTLYAAYAVAINEGRGIYINRSLDAGRTWELPVQVFDAEAAQWEMVSSPSLAFSGGRLHMLWQHGSFSDDDAARGLGYAYSDDNGTTWSSADTTINDTLQWSGLAATEDGTTLRVWQQTDGDQPVIVSQVSTNRGETWSAPSSVASFGEILGRPKLLTTDSGEIHLLQMNRDYLGNTVLRNWFWYNGSWAADAAFELSSDAANNVVDLSGVTIQEEKLAVVYAAQNPNLASQSIQMVVRGDRPDTRAPEALPMIQATATPTAEPTAAATETAEPNQAGAQTAETAAPEQPTATVPAETPTSTPTTQATPTSPGGQGSSPDGEPNSWMGLLLGIGLAVVIVVGVFGYRIAKSRA